MPKKSSSMSPFEEIAKQYQEYFRTGQLSAMALGIDEWYYDAVLPIHTTGSFTSSTPVISGANQTCSTLNISGLGTYAFKKGVTSRPSRPGSTAARLPCWKPPRAS